MKDKLKETLTNILSYLLRVERKTLLWTNPNPTAAMTGTVLVASGADAYDAIEVIYKTAHVYNGYQSVRAPYVNSAHITLCAPSGSTGEFSGTVINAIRTVSISNGKLTADQAVTMGTGGVSTNNNMCIPYKVYGIKLGGGVLLSSIFKAYRRFASSEGGGVSETETERTPRQNACALYCDILQRCAVVRELAHFHRLSLCKQCGSIHYTISCRHIFTSILCNSILWSRRLWCIRHYQHNEFIDHINNTVPIQFSRCRNGGFCSRNRTGITPERGCAV